MKGFQDLTVAPSGSPVVEKEPDNRRGVEFCLSFPEMGLTVLLTREQMEAVVNAGSKALTTTRLALVQPKAAARG